MPNSAVRLLIFGLAVIGLTAVLPVACADGGTGTQPRESPTPATPSTTGELSTAEPTLSATEPAPVAEIRAVDFEEDPTQLSEPYQEEGWRRVGVYLDVLYNGGIERENLACGLAPGGTILAPNSGEYALDGEYKLARPILLPLAADCAPLSPGVKVRLYMEAEVPEVLPTIEGSTVSVVLGDSDPLGFDIYFEDVVAFEKSVPFSPGPAAQSAQPFGVSVPIDGGSLEIVDVTAYSPPDRNFWDSFGTVTYRIMNNSNYDLASLVDNGTLIDGRGYPYALYPKKCVVPPGFTEDCYLDISGIWGPSPGHKETIPPDLSDVSVILIPGPFVFRGSGQ